MPLPLAAIGVGAGLKFLGGILGGASKAKAAKMKAKNDQAMAQYKINMKQKGLNRKSLNFGSLLKALGREGWFGDPNAEGSFMKTKGSVYNASDFNYDPVPLGATPGVFSSAMGEGLRGGVQGIEDWYQNDQAAEREAAGMAAPTSPGQPTGFTANTSGIQFNPYGAPTEYEDFGS